MEAIEENGKGGKDDNNHSNNKDGDEDGDDNNNDDWTSSKKNHVRVGSDEVSALSNSSWLSQGSHLSARQLEHIANFEKQQQEEFERKKEEMGKRLTNVLNRDLPTVRKNSLDSLIVHEVHVANISSTSLLFSGKGKGRFY